VVWVSEENRNWKITFHANGKFSREGLPLEGKGTWMNLGGGFYGVYITDGHKEISMFKINSNLTKLEHRWGIRCHLSNWERTTSLPPETTTVPPIKPNVSRTPPTSASAPVSGKHILSNTKWRFGNADTYMIAFYPDGSYAQKTGTNISRGKWLVTDSATIRSASGNITFTISADRLTITQSTNGKSYVWNYAGFPKSPATAQTEQVTPKGEVSASSTKKQVTYPEVKMPVEEAFVELNIIFERTYNNALAERNKKDVAALEDFIKRVILSDSNIAKSAKEAIEVVRDNEAFFAIPPHSKRNQTSYERELWKMKTARDNAIEEVARIVGGNFTERYRALLRRAASTGEVSLATNIKRKLKYIKLPQSPWNHGIWLGKIDAFDIANRKVSFFWEKGGYWFENEGRHVSDTGRLWRKVESGENIGINWELHGWNDYILTPDGKRMQSKGSWYFIRIK
jgi:hypothetical protein